MENVELRPMSLGELLDRAFTLYRRHFWLFVGIMAVPAMFSIPMGLLFSGMRGNPFSPASPPSPAVVGSLLTAVFLIVVVSTLVYALAGGAATCAVSESYLGRNVTVRGSYNKVRGKFLRIIGVALSVMLRVIGVAILGSIAAGIMAIAFTAGIRSFAGSPSALVGIILAVALFVIYLVLLASFVLWALRYAIAIPALMLEGLGVNAAIRRSVQLTQGAKRRLFVAVVLAFIIAYVGVIIFQGPFLLTMFLFAQPARLPAWMTFLSSVCGAVGGAITGPFLLIVLVLCYYDARIRKEAFDLQFMMSALDGPAQAAPGAVSPA